jgi:hypothetical protein
MPSKWRSWAKFSTPAWSNGDKTIVDELLRAVPSSSTGTEKPLAFTSCSSSQPPGPSEPYPLIEDNLQWVIYQDSAGYIDPAPQSHPGSQRAPLTCVASLTKPATAACAIAGLVEQGLSGLDGDVLRPLVPAARPGPGPRVARRRSGLTRGTHRSSLPPSLGIAHPGHS